MRLGWRAAGLLLLAWQVPQLVAGQTETRRSGSSDMSPTLQAMQRDDAANPAQLWVQEGEALWRQPASNGRRCTDCHEAVSMQDAALRHPAFDAALRRPVTLEGRIDACRQRHQALQPEGPDGPQVLALSAWLAHLARGRPIAPPQDARLKPWQERGHALWQQRLGQLDLSCAQCHDQRAGLSLGGVKIPQAHPTGYPIYRLEWQSLGSLQRRVRGCVAGVRAEPFAADADEWLALQVWLMRRAAGMPGEGAALRP